MKFIEIQKNEHLYQKALKLRHELFFREHGLPFEKTTDEKEDKSQHYAISEDKKLISYGRLFMRKIGKFEVSQIVVSPEYQGKGYGTKLLSELIRVSKDKGAKFIILSARITALGLYRKFGFQQIGKVFKSHKTGIEHVKMILINCN